MKHDVFISYSSHDKQIADAICSVLENNNVGCWIAPRDILPGKEYGEAIINAIANCKILLLVFSAKANNSPFIRKEVERAVAKGKIIVPFRIEDILPTKAMEFVLSDTQWLDALTPPLESHIRKLTKTIQTFLGQGVVIIDRPKSEPQHPNAPAPYVPIIGLLIIDSDNAEIIINNFGIVYSFYSTIKSGILISRGSGSKEIRWDTIASVILESPDNATINFVSNDSIDHVKLNAGRLVGSDKDGFTYTFEFAKLKSVTPLLDTSAPEFTALLRDIPVFAKRTPPTSSYSSFIVLESDPEGILVTVDLYFQKQPATNGHHVFRLPGLHTFTAGDHFVNCNIASKGLINLGDYDRETAFELAHAFSRLNYLLQKEKAGIE